jgi:hypothetical protein
MSGTYIFSVAIRGLPFVREYAGRDIRAFADGGENIVYGYGFGIAVKQKTAAGAPDGTDDSGFFQAETYLFQEFRGYFLFRGYSFDGNRFAAGGFRQIYDRAKGVPSFCRYSHSSSRLLSNLP